MGGSQSFFKQKLVLKLVDLVIVSVICLTIREFAGKITVVDFSVTVGLIGAAGTAFGFFMRHFKKNLEQRNKELEQRNKELKKKLEIRKREP